MQIIIDGAPDEFAALAGALQGRAEDADTREKLRKLAEKADDILYFTHVLRYGPSEEELQKEHERRLAEFPEIFGTQS